MQSINKFAWNENGFDITLEQNYNGMYHVEIKENGEFITGTTCKTANEGHKFIADRITIN
jgi:hypothetical protein